MASKEKRGRPRANLPREKPCTRQRARSGVGYEPRFTPLCLPERLQNGGAAPACPRRLLPSAPPLRGPPRLGAGVPPKITRERRAVREGAAFPSSSGSHERVKSDEDAPPAGQSEQAGRARGLQGPGRFPCKQIKVFLVPRVILAPRVGEQVCWRSPRL